jgi:hypothetical protein
MLVIGNVVDLIKGALLCEMTKQTQFIDNPEIGHHPDIDVPGKIPKQEIKKACEGRYPSPMIAKPDKIRSNQTNDGHQERGDKGDPAAMCYQQNFFSFLQGCTHKPSFYGSNKVQTIGNKKQMENRLPAWPRI